jgi:hypothetical protein
MEKKPELNTIKNNIRLEADTVAEDKPQGDIEK